MRDLFAVVSRLSSFMLSLVVVSQVIATAAAAGWLAGWLSSRSYDILWENIIEKNMNSHRQSKELDVTMI